MVTWEQIFLNLTEAIEGWVFYKCADLQWHVEHEGDQAQMLTAFERNPELFIGVILFSLAFRLFIKKLNKKQNDAMYMQLEKLTPAQVVRAWIITIAKYRILFELYFVIEVTALLSAFIFVDSIDSSLTQYFFAVMIVYAVIRTSLQWMKIIYFRNLSSSMQVAAASHFNSNIRNSVQEALQDPDLVNYLRNKPNFLRNYVSKRLYAMKSIPANLGK
jgi:hypothetical protein